MIRWLQALDGAAPLGPDEAVVWLVEPAGPLAATALARVRPTPADLADAASWDGVERGAARLRRRLLLRAFAAALLRAPADAVAAGRTPEGRPFLHAPRPLHASVARRGGWAALAVSDAPVGVDLEQVDAAPPLDLLPPPERAEAQALGPAATPQRFAELWAARESYVKATGAGLARAEQLSARHADDGVWVRGPSGVATVALRACGPLVAAAVRLAPVATTDEAATAARALERV